MEYNKKHVFVNAVRVNSNRVYKAMFLGMLAVMIIAPTYSLIILCVSGLCAMLITALHYLKQINSSRVADEEWQATVIKLIGSSLPNSFSEPAPVKVQNNHKSYY